jgi:hypothetical protein
VEYDESLVVRLEDVRCHTEYGTPSCIRTLAVNCEVKGEFRTATRILEDSFQKDKLDLNEATTSFNRLTASFEDLSLIQDRELRKVTDDARKALLFAVEGSTDSARVLRMDESIVELRKNINMMIDKAGAAAQRLRRGVR